MVFLMLIKKPIKAKCVLTGKTVRFKGPCGFFMDQNLSKPVSPEEALKNGFSMTPAVFSKIQKLISEGMIYEKIQKSARHEIDILQEDN